MATVSRELPRQPHLDVPRREARELLAAWRARRPEALERIQHQFPKLKDAPPETVAAAPFKLADAQFVIAREYGFASWTLLKQRIAAGAAVPALQGAIHAGDRAAVVRILRAHPELVHVPVWSGNWGPPLSHAANLGRLEIIQACHELGARDHQHALGRALIQGQIETARWLLAHGARPTPGDLMGCCETLNVAGFTFLLEHGLPLADEHGHRLAPLAGVLETYGRAPARKHALVALLARHGLELPDTPVMALHRGDLVRLEAHLRGDPGLLARHFCLREIYPAECGCGRDGRSGMHWTPIDGGTLLHLAVDFREAEIAAWLLAHGADVNARATVDAEGFGGQTPLFNTLVCGQPQDLAIARLLLDHHAATDVRASLRKFLDWCEEPRWHLARDVTPLEWARTFPERGWVNEPAMALLAQKRAPI